MELDGDGMVQIWDVNDGTCARQYSLGAKPSSITLSSGGRFVAGGTARIWSISSTCEEPLYRTNSLDCVTAGPVQCCAVCQWEEDCAAS